VDSLRAWVADRAPILSAFAILFGSVLVLIVISVLRG